MSMWRAGLGKVGERSYTNCYTTNLFKTAVLMLIIKRVGSDECKTFLTQLQFVCVVIFFFYFNFKSICKLQ